MSDEVPGQQSIDDVLTSPCRTGCKTKSHESYAECLKDAALQIGNLK